MTAAHSDDAAPRLRDFVAEEVRAILARQRISGAELARRVGRSQTFIAKRLDGRQAFDIDDLELISGVLGLPVTAFLPSPQPLPDRPQSTPGDPKMRPVAAGGTNYGYPPVTRPTHLRVVPDHPHDDAVTEMAAA